MRMQARVVVIGGGVVGCSLLYHLARLGWHDTLLLDFIGRDALVRQRDEGLTQTLACLTIDLDPADTLFPRGGEPLMSAGEPVGYHRAAHPGHAVGATIGLAYLPIALAVVGSRLEVEILGERRGAVVVGAPLYDPIGERMRGSPSYRTTVEREVMSP